MCPPCSAPLAGTASQSGADRAVHRTPWRLRPGFLIGSARVRASSDLRPTMRAAWTGTPACPLATSPKFTAAVRGEDAYRPLVERIAGEAIATIEAGGIQVAADYELPGSDRRALEDRRAEGGYLERMRATYIGGVDGWIDDCIAMTRPWGFDLAEIAVPTSVWYGVADVLVSKTHAEHLLAAIPHAERRELSGGHVLEDRDLSAVYEWLASASR